MSVLKKIWVDPVGSKVIATGVIAIVAFIIAKCKSKVTKANSNKLFTILDEKPVQISNYSCIKVSFRSNNDVAEFERRGGKLVGYDNLVGLIREDCPFLQWRMNSLFFKIKRFCFLRHKKAT